VTTPARTVADLRRIGTVQEVRRAIRQANVLGLSIQGPDGIGATDRAGIEGEMVKRTRSELEWMFFELCQEHLLPLPEINVRIGSLEVDFLWRGRRLIVETDGYQFHRGRQAFEEDHARGLELKAHGYEVLRFTYRQVVGEREQIVALLRSLLDIPTSP
jgi:very-short-patch-repair endonuclease